MAGPYDYLLANHGSVWGQGASMEQVENLQKALTAGSGINPADFTSGRAMTVESLESTLINQLWSEDEAKLFRLIKSEKAGSVVHQWAERTSVGDIDGAFVAEGGASVAHDQVLDRQFTTAKFIQTRREATLQAVIQGDNRMMLEEALALETNAGALWCVRVIEKMLFHANSDYNPLAFDGLEKQITDYNSGSNVIDVRAEASNATFENSIKTGADIIRRNYGRADCMFADTETLTAFQQRIEERTRFPIDQAPNRDVVGNLIFNKYATPHGRLDLYDDLFISADGATDGAGAVPSASSNSDAPGAGAITAATQAAAAISGISSVSQTHWSSDDVGFYRYKVVAVNGFGDGAAEDCTGNAVNIQASERTTHAAHITVTVPTGAARPTAIKLYRTRKASAASGVTTDSEARYVKTVAVPDDTSTTVNIYDANADLPGTSKAFILTLQPRQKALAWFQFLPMMRFNLYPASAATWPFLVLLYGSLALFKPGRHIMLKNIIPTSLDWFD